MFAQSAETSCFNFLRNDGEDHVLVASPHHCPQDVARSYNVADIAGRGDLLAVDADDDVSLLESRSVAQEEEIRISFQTFMFSAHLGRRRPWTFALGLRRHPNLLKRTQFEVIWRDKRHAKLVLSLCDPVCSSTGTPQGSVLLPLLFILYTHVLEFTLKQEDSQLCR